VKGAKTIHQMAERVKENVGKVMVGKEKVEGRRDMPIPLLGAGEVVK